MTVLQELTRPFPDKFVHTNPSGGGSYIKHHVINQRLIQVFGRPPSFEKVEVLYGDVPEIKPNPSGSSKRAKEGRPALKQAVVGVICRMTVEIDGEKVVVEEAGDCEEPHNWTTDGQRIKDAMSDAYKRCAMRLGCGLHLWSQDEYFLHDELSKDSVAATPVSTPQPKLDEKAATREVKEVGSKETSPSQQPHRVSEEPTAEEATTPVLPGPNGSATTASGKASAAPPKDDGGPVGRPAGSSESLAYLNQIKDDGKLSKARISIILMKHGARLGGEPPKEEREHAYHEDWTLLSPEILAAAAEEARQKIGASV